MVSGKIQSVRLENAATADFFLKVTDESILLTVAIYAGNTITGTLLQEPYDETKEYFDNMPGIMALLDKAEQIKKNSRYAVSLAKEMYNNKR